VTNNPSETSRPHDINFSRSEAVGLLSLASIKGVGFQTLWKLSEAGHQFSEVLALEKTEEAAELLSLYGARLEKSLKSDWKVVHEKIRERGLKVFHDLSRQKISILNRLHPAFPKSLMNLKDPPHWLFVQGNVDVLSRPSISVVGTRKPSRAGIWLTEFVGLCLHEWRCPTVSGLALGIDQAIHSASIEADVPTIAVLGTGIQSDYPANALKMRSAIIDSGGALITEYLPGDSYSAQNFVRRNRLQAALGRALVPVEWRSKSGTAHTVRFAIQLKRPIASLSMPTWSSEKSTLSELTVSGLSQTFVIPGEEAEFRAFIQKALETSPVSSLPDIEQPQPSLLDRL